jgi:hypothetical protein
VQRLDEISGIHVGPQQTPSSVNRGPTAALLGLVARFRTGFRTLHARDHHGSVIYPHCAHAMDCNAARSTEHNIGTHD